MRRSQQGLSKSGVTANMNDAYAPLPVINRLALDGSSASELPRYRISGNASGLETYYQRLLNEGRRDGALKNSCKWDEIIDQLDLWRVCPDIDGEHDIAPPTMEALRVAIAWATRFRGSDKAPPTSILPTGAGGIAFYLRVNARRLESIRVEASGVARLVVFDSGRVADMSRLPAIS